MDVKDLFLDQDLASMSGNEINNHKAEEMTISGENICQNTTNNGNHSLGLFDNGKYYIKFVRNG